MASVTGYEYSKAMQIKDESVISAQIINGVLIFTTYGGTQFSGGVVTGDLPLSQPSIVTLGAFDKEPEDVLVSEWNTGGINASTTMATFGSTSDNIAWSPDNLYLAQSYAAPPYLKLFKRSALLDNVMTDLGSGAVVTPPTDRAASGGSSWSPDGKYLAVCQGAAPYLNIYKRSGDVLTRLASTPGTVSAVPPIGVSWSPDGRYLSVTYALSPFIAIYKRSGDTFTLLSGGTGPTSNPGVWVTSSRFSPNGRYLVLSLNASPYAFVYKRNADVFSYLPFALDFFPTASASEVGWSPDSAYLTISTIDSKDLFYYKRTADAFVNLNTSGLLSSSQNPKGHSWSPDGKYIAISHDVSPFVSIFRRRFNDTFEKMPDLDTSMLFNAPTSIAWAPDGSSLSLAFGPSPHVLTYKSALGKLKKAATKAIQT